MGRLPPAGTCGPVPSVSLLSSMVVSALGDIGIRSPAFTGASCRMGGLTVATEAGVPEAFMWMRSGHAQDRAARRYVRLTNPDRLSTPGDVQPLILEWRPRWTFFVICSTPRSCRRLAGPQFRPTTLVS